MTNETDIAVWLDLGQGTVVPVSESISFGRLKESDVCVDDSGVSRRHAIIQRRSGPEFWLIDLGSRNGTSINGRHLVAPVRLVDGDVIEVGDMAAVFRRRASHRENGISSDTQAVRTTSTRIVSVAHWMLVTDVVGSTKLAAQTAEEDFARAMGKFMRLTSDVVSNHNGSINKYLGDGFLGYWRNNGSAAEHVLEALRALKALQQKPNVLDFRVALHYGMVALAADGAIAEESLLGRHVGLVFRMEELAKELDQTILISDTAKSRLSRIDGLIDLGLHQLAEIHEKMRMFGWSSDR